MVCPSTVLRPSGQEATYAVQQAAPLFEHLVGGGVQLQRDVEAERLGGLEVEHELPLTGSPSTATSLSLELHTGEDGSRSPNGLVGRGDEWRLAGKRGEVRVAVGGSFRSNNAAMLRAAALDGIGIAVLPTWAVAEPLRAGALRRVLDVWEPPASTIYAVYPGNKLMSMKVRAFVDHLVRCFGRTPYWDNGL
jgi:DNA-binding transcriptional LysR family regulator